MTINDYGLSRYGQLKEEVDLFNEMGITPISRLTGIVNCVNQAINDLKEFLKLNPFSNDQEEIVFFKTIKPGFIAWQIYALEVYTIETGRPVGDELILKTFYEQEFNYSKRFIFQYQFLYQYFEMSVTELDSLFFLRGVPNKPFYILHNMDTDPAFSTSCDYLFAKFMAIKMVQDYLITCIKEPGTTETIFKQSKKGRSLKWTGDKSNLVEIAYGIYDTCQINEGKVDISDIVDWLEQSLNVNLSRYYRRFTEIKRRKSMSKTRYLDEMAAALNKHIDEGDAFRPGSNSF